MDDDVVASAMTGTGDVEGTSRFLKEPYTKLYIPATHPAPPMRFPMETGRRFLNKKSLIETGAPRRIPKGIRNMFATDCSNPRAINDDIGNQIASILPGAELHPLAIYTAIDTNQLHNIPRMSAA